MTHPLNSDLWTVILNKLGNGYAVVMLYTSKFISTVSKKVYKNFSARKLARLCCSNGNIELLNWMTKMGHLSPSDWQQYLDMNDSDFWYRKTRDNQFSDDDLYTHGEGQIAILQWLNTRTYNPLSKDDLRQCIWRSQGNICETRYSGGSFPLFIACSTRPFDCQSFTKEVMSAEKRKWILVCCMCFIKTGDLETLQWLKTMVDWHTDDSLFLLVVQHGNVAMLELLRQNDMDGRGATLGTIHICVPDGKFCYIFHRKYFGHNDEAALVAAERGDMSIIEWVIARDSPANVV